MGNIWNINSFNNIAINSQEIINATTLTLNYYNKLYNLGYKVPKFVLILGLDNGPTTTMNALYGEINFITKNYLNKFPQLFVNLYGKPLLIIFDGSNIHNNYPPLNNTNQYTLKWMASQFQINNLNNQGYYSWMDGTITPYPTYKKNKKKK